MSTVASFSDIDAPVDALPVAAYLATDRNLVPVPVRMLKKWGLG